MYNEWIGIDLFIIFLLGLFIFIIIICLMWIWIKNKNFRARFTDNICPHYYNGFCHLTDDENMKKCIGYSKCRSLKIYGRN
jgi:hypothetical protein